MHPATHPSSFKTPQSFKTYGHLPVLACELREGREAHLDFTFKDKCMSHTRDVPKTLASLNPKLIIPTPKQ